jgi:hypothetical protein
MLSGVHGLDVLGLYKSTKIWNCKYAKRTTDLKITMAEVNCG